MPQLPRHYLEGRLARGRQAGSTAGIHIPPQPRFPVEPTLALLRAQEELGLTITEGAQEITSILASIRERRQEAENFTATLGGETDFVLEGRQALEKESQSADFRTLVERVRPRLSLLRDIILERFAQPEVRQQVQKRLDRQQQRLLIGADWLSGKQMVEAGRADLERSLANLSNVLAFSSSERDLKDARAAMAYALEGSLAAGIISAPERESLQRETLARASEAQLRARMLGDPDGVVAELVDTERHVELEPTKRVMLLQQSLERVGSRERAEERLGMTKIRLLGDLRGAVSEEVKGRIEAAQSVEDLVEVMGDLGAEVSQVNVSGPELALAAARGDKDAMRALELLNQDKTRTTVAQLAERAAQGDEVAQRAIEILKSVRFSGRRRGGEGVSGAVSRFPRRDAEPPKRSFSEPEKAAIQAIKEAVNRREMTPQAGFFMLRDDVGLNAEQANEVIDDALIAPAAPGPPKGGKAAAAPPQEEPPGPKPPDASVETKSAGELHSLHMGVYYDTLSRTAAIAELMESGYTQAAAEGIVSEMHRKPPPATHPEEGVSAGDLVREVMGGLRDAAQDLIEIPTHVINSVTEFISPDPPGGPRRRLIAKLEPPLELPEVVRGETMAERGTRLLAQVVFEVLPHGAGALKALGLRLGPKASGLMQLEKAVAPLDDMSRLLLRSLTGVQSLESLPKARLVKLLEDLEAMERAAPGLLDVQGEFRNLYHRARDLLHHMEGVSVRPVGEVAEEIADGKRTVVNKLTGEVLAEETAEEGTQAAAKVADDAGDAVRASDIPTEGLPTRQEAEAILGRPMSEAASNLARVFDIGPGTRHLRQMTHEQAIQARRRLLTRLSSVDLVGERPADDPLVELLRLLEAQIVRTQPR